MTANTETSAPTTDEQAVENTEQAAEETTKVWSPEDITDPAKRAMATIVFEEVAKDVVEYNTGRRRLDAANGDTTPLVQDFIRNSDDPAIVKQRDKYDALILQAEKIMADLMVTAREQANVTLTDEEKSALETTLKELRSSIKAGLDFAEKKFTGISSHPDLALVGSKGSGKGKGGAGSTGGVKPRVSTIYVDGVPATEEVKDSKNGGTKVVSTFTIAAKRLDVKVTDLHAAYFAAAEVSPADWSNAPDSVEFALTVGDKNHTVRVDK